MNNTRDANFAWVSNQNLSEFQGEWVVVVDKKIIASGPNAAEVIKKSRAACPGKRPFLVKVPKNSVIS